MTFGKTLSLGALFITGALAKSGLAHAGTPAADLYGVVVIEDAAYGELLTARDADGAIAGISRRLQGNRHGFAELNNLCVAYIISKDISSASPVCERAVGLGERKSRSASAWNIAQRNREYAIALTNRGVLEALTGDHYEAERDFVRASRLFRSLPQPRDNLSRLERKSSLVVGQASTTSRSGR